jgi:hypothetical protein
MAWGRNRDRDALKAQKYERGYFERLLRYALDDGNFALALSGMTVRHEFSFNHPLSGGPPVEVLRHYTPEWADGPTFFGVLHEPWGRSNHMQSMEAGKLVWATLNIGGKTKSPDLGYAVFQSSMEPKDIPPLNRQLSVKVVVGDDDGAILRTLSDALRDKAMSGGNFFHVMFGLEKIETDALLRELLEGKGFFEVRIRRLSLMHDIVLPKSPSWSWKWHLSSRELV